MKFFLFAMSYEFNACCFGKKRLGSVDGVFDVRLSGT